MSCLSLDTSAGLTDKGRKGTATLKFGTGAFHGATGYLTYDFECTSGCFNEKGEPASGPFTVNLSGTGSLNLQLGTAQAVLPDLFLPPADYVVQHGQNGNVTTEPPGTTVPIYHGENFPRNFHPRAGNNNSEQPFLDITPSAAPKYCHMLIEDPLFPHSLFRRIAFHRRKN
jgi:hypothetical protein